MASTQALSAAAQDRKARLAQLKSLKRKQPDDAWEAEQSIANGFKDGQDSTDQPNPGLPSRDKADQNETDPASKASEEVTAKYLSGRNYDPETKGAKLGFEQAPSAGRETLESRAQSLAAAVQQQQQADKAAGDASDAPLDLFALQPKKPNWDLKRDLQRKLDVLDVRTDNAIAKLVRERIAAQQQAAKATAAGGDDAGEAVGLDGVTLVEATNVREREDEEEARREREEEEEDAEAEALLDAT